MIPYLLEMTSQVVALRLTKTKKHIATDHTPQTTAWTYYLGLTNPTP